MASVQAAADVESPGFFRRNRAPRLISGFVITAVLIVAYLFGIFSYQAGLAQALPEQSPPTGGVSVVIVPQKVSPDDQTLPAQVLLFPAPDLLDTSDLLTREIEVRIEPAVSGQALTFPAGESPAPQAIVLPAAGIVQQYPFDSYAVSATVDANARSADPADAIASEASLFFRVPGGARRTRCPQTVPGRARSSRRQVVRDGSTKSIALLLLLLMIILAAIAILVTGSATRGRMKLELSVASWMTALLFALIPLRGFFPGSPPLGSWMDILVFFWVELILMLSVSAVAVTILVRARDASRHPAD
jgi:hypothetical protein